jgi:hypothetical protein
MLEEKIKENFRKAVSNLVDAAKMEILQQGHKASGRLINSLSFEIDASRVNRLIAYIYAEDYGLIVDEGVKAARVPFGGGRGGTSAYIEGLLNWVDYVRPGLQIKEKFSFVFAVANTHKKEGIPSRGSFSFSRNGRRRSWIKFGIENNLSKLEEDLQLFNAINASFEQALNLRA